MKKRYKLGFTLIELLVVMAILGILATISLVTFRTTQMRSRDAQRKSDLKQTANALEIFYNDYERYPSASIDGKIMACPSSTVPATGCSWDNDDIFTDNKTTYLKSMAEDPSGGFNYYYEVFDNNQGYRLFAHLENTQDSDIDTTISKPCGASICNFSVESSNGQEVQE